MSCTEQVVAVEKGEATKKGQEGFFFVFLFKKCVCVCVFVGVCADLLLSAGLVFPKIKIEKMSRGADVSYMFVVLSPGFDAPCFLVRYWEIP